MVFGDKSAFAIEIDDVETSTTYLYGVIFLWVGNVRLGDPAVSAILSTPALFFADFLTNREGRATNRFKGMDADSIVATVFQRVEAEYPLVTYDSVFAPMLIAPGGGESHDSYVLLVVEEGDVQHIIYKDDDQDFAGEEEVPMGTVEAAITQCLEWFHAESAQIQS